MQMGESGGEKERERRKERETDRVHKGGSEVVELVWGSEERKEPEEGKFTKGPGECQFWVRRITWVSTFDFPGVMGHLRTV